MNRFPARRSILLIARPFSILLAAAAFTSAAAQFKFGEQTFTLPDGFVMERAAPGGLVPRPIEMDFDEEGHLYVTDSSGSNAPVTEQLKQKPHRVLRLSDTDGDGVFDQTTVFADHMMFPEGCMWYNGSLYVSAPPVIWKLSDLNGDGVAEKREEWLDAKTLTGCANDLHGPYLGLDGWVYWSKGAFAEQTWEQPDGTVLKTRAAHIFRRRPEGGLLESVMTGGMDNPVGVVFTPEGERIFTTTFLQNPGGGKRDGLIHAIYGGVYGKVHDVIDGHQRTGDLMPVLDHLGPAAPCGLARYESTVFGADYQNNLFATLFNMHKVTRHILHSEGASYRTEDIDFLTCDSTDFHPTDVLEDADGSLLVIDTGGWYKICCPTSQLYKPDLLGAIYRIRRSGAKPVEDPRGKKIAWGQKTSTELAQLLGDVRPAVVKHATLLLESKKDESVQPITSLFQGTNSVSTRLNAVWALTRIDQDSARAGVREALRDSNASIQHAAIQSISVRRDWKAVGALITSLHSTNAPVRRAAAEALGRMGDPQAIAPLLSSAGELQIMNGSIFPDRIEEHSIIYALIEIHQSNATRNGLASASPLIHRAALIALDQMREGNLSGSDVIPLLDSQVPLLKQTAFWIIEHHLDWNRELLAHFRDRLKSPVLPADDQQLISDTLVRLSSEVDMQQLLAEIAADPKRSDAARLTALRAMEQSHLKNPPLAWAQALTLLTQSSSAALQDAAIQAASALYTKSAPADLQSALLKVAQTQAANIGLRLAALNALPNSAWDQSLFDFVRASTSPDHPVNVRVKASSLLARAKLSDDQLCSLAENIGTAGPLEITRLLTAFENSSSERVGSALLNQLSGSKSLAAIPPDQIKNVLGKYPESIRKRGHELLSQVDTDGETQAKRIDELLPKINGGDIRRGQAVFNSAKASCSSCHAIGYIGGNVGPDLTRVGQIRTERDLLEAIVFPSASFVRSFEPMIVLAKNGDEYSGVMKTEGSDELVLATGPQTEARIARADIAEMRPGRVSVMPQGLDQQLTIQELGDLVAFLKSNK